LPSSTTSLRVGLKDLFNFDQASYRRAQSLSRDGMDVALMLDNVSSQQRRRILRVIKTVRLQ
jgi:ribosomal protein L5